MSTRRAWTTASGERLYRRRAWSWSGAMLPGPQGNTRRTVTPPCEALSWRERPSFLGPLLTMIASAVHGLFVCPGRQKNFMSKEAARNLPGEAWHLYKLNAVPAILNPILSSPALSVTHRRTRQVFFPERIAYKRRIYDEKTNPFHSAGRRYGPHPGRLRQSGQQPVLRPQPKP